MAILSVTSEDENINKKTDTPKYMDSFQHFKGHLSKQTSECCFGNV